MSIVRFYWFSSFLQRDFFVDISVFFGIMILIAHMTDGIAEHRGGVWVEHADRLGNSAMCWIAFLHFCKKAKLIWGDRI